MQTLKNNILSIFGETGRVWLEELNQLVKKLQDYWFLKELHPVSNMTYNFVARALNSENIPVVLKISCDKNLIEEEANALKYFNGQGSIVLLDQHRGCHALLLQQAIPGTPLKSLYPAQQKLTMESFIGVAAKLHSRPLPKKHSFGHISDWLEALDEADTDEIPQELLTRAIKLKNRLLDTIKNEKVLHGDLHLDNILHHGDEWLSIDPKGVVGEPEFEIAAFDFIDDTELAKATSEMLLSRIEQVAQIAGLSPQRIKEWTFVRLILAAAWAVEDRAGPSITVKTKLANYLKDE